MVWGVGGLALVNAICWNGSFLVKFGWKQQFINPCTHLWLWLLFSSLKLLLEDVMLVVPAILSQNKGNTKQRYQLARKQRKYHNYVHLCVSYDGTVNIYATEVLFPSYMISGSSHVGSFFTNEEKNMLTYDVMYTSAICTANLFMISQTWTVIFFHDFQAWIFFFFFFSKLDHKPFSLVWKNKNHLHNPYWSNC